MGTTVTQNVTPSSVFLWRTMRTKQTTCAIMNATASSTTRTVVLTTKVVKPPALYQSTQEPTREETSHQTSHQTNHQTDSPVSHPSGPGLTLDTELELDLRDNVSSADA